MNRDQFNRTEMFNTVSAYMHTNQSLWTATKAVADTVDALDASIAVIEGKAGKQQTPITGAADQKAQVRLSCEEKILELSDQLSALAEVKSDANLAAQTNWTLSSLDKRPTTNSKKPEKASRPSRLQIWSRWPITPSRQPM